MGARVCQGNLKERGYFQYRDVDGTIILKLMLKEQGGLVHLKIGKSGGVLPHRIGASDYIKSRIIMTYSETVSFSRMAVLRGVN